ncbi:MAG: protein arginine kinase [Clostridia bacterium]|nr:protein arginine kinase [Clostridia bacterium]
MGNRANENDIAVSTRVRLARNVKGVPFPSRMSAAAAENMIDSVFGAMQNSVLKDSISLYKMENLSDLQKSSLIERHLISTELANSKTPAAAIISEDESICVMINEEDHLRIQVFKNGLDAEGAYREAKNIENLLSETLSFDYDKEFGFLTSCPTNAGTGLRASVMLHLPAICISKSVNPLLKWAANLGMTVRGLYGEGSKASGSLFQLSNQITLGVSEEEILSRFTAAACSLISEERRICAELFENNKSAMTDKCLRSLGILKNAYMIPSAEALELVSNVCMGANSGIIKNIDSPALRRQMFLSMPATLERDLGPLASEERDIHRAQMLQKALSD